MKRNYTIYGYYQPAENKWYVGRTFRTQISRAGRKGQGYKNCHKFYSAIHQYGWPSFEYHILDTTTDKDEAYRLERYWIEQKNSVENGYNKCPGGASTEGYKFSNESRELLSRVHSGEGNPNFGKHFSDEHKRNISLSNRNNPKQPCKRVQQYTRDGQLVAEYPSVMEAHRQTNINRAHISSCSLGKLKSAGGFIWKAI